MRNGSVIAVLLLLGCGAPYVAPCRVAERGLVLDESAASAESLRPQADGSVVAIWRHSDGAMEVAVVGPKDRAIRHRYAPARITHRDFWTQEALARISSHAESLPTENGVPHSKTRLRLQTLTHDGALVATVEVPGTDCLDCVVPWAAQTVEGKLVFLFVGADGRFHFAAFELPTGVLAGSGALDWLSTGRLDVTLAEFAFRGEPKTLLVTTADGAWLTDWALRPKVGPIREAAPILLTAQGTGALAAWSVEDTWDVFIRPFSSDGQPIAAPNRVTRGWLEAWAVTDGLAGAVVSYEPTRYLAIWDVTARRKLGGDVELGPSSTSAFPFERQLLQGDSGVFTHWSWTAQGIERVKITCEH